MHCCATPVRIEAAPAATTAEKVTQQVYFVHKEKKQSLIVELLNNEAIKRVLIFTRTKRGADRLATYLERNRIKTEAIHGDKDQRDRQTALNCFKSGQVRALVATDVAARGIDVSGVTHVINFDLPTDSESYVHRIGRTARAGKAGVAISFCDRDEHKYLRTIERATKQNMSVIVDHPFHAADICQRPRRVRPQACSVEEASGTALSRCKEARRAVQKRAARPSTDLIYRRLPNPVDQRGKHLKSDGSRGSPRGCPQSVGHQVPVAPAPGISCRYPAPVDSQHSSTIRHMDGVRHRPAIRGF